MAFFFSHKDVWVLPIQGNRCNLWSNKWSDTGTGQNPLLQGPEVFHQEPRTASERAQVCGLCFSVLWSTVLSAALQPRSYT